MARQFDYSEECENFAQDHWKEAQVEPDVLIAQHSLHATVFISLSIRFPLHFAAAERNCHKTTNECFSFTTVRQYFAINKRKGKM